VAFFALHRGAQIPLGYSFVDILFQQLAPVSTWGKTFFVPVSWRKRDFVRIVASQNGTNITQKGGQIRYAPSGKYSLTNLNAGEWEELEVFLDSNGCYIESNKEIGVCTYLTGTTYNDPTDELSDPAQAWLPPIEQKIKTAMITPFIPTVATNLKDHFALIITPTITKDSTTVKIGTGAEQALSGGTWLNNAASGMSFYSYLLTNKTDVYLFANRTSGLLIMGYGTGTAESYYYLSSSGMRTLGAEFYVNDIYYQSLSSEIICTQPLQFKAKIEGDMSADTGHLKWYIDGMEETSAKDKLTWNKVMPTGIYHIKMEVTMENNILTKTVEGILNVVSVEITNVNDDTTLCLTSSIVITGTPKDGRWESSNPTVAQIDENGYVANNQTGSTEIMYIIESTGCKDTASIMLNITYPVVEAETTPEICGNENGTITLSVKSDAPNTVAYLWDKRSETTPALTNLKAGTYHATVSDTFCVITKTIQIEHINGPIADFNANSHHIIKNKPVVLTDMSQGNIQIWNWDMGNGTAQTGTLINYAYPDTGTYTIQLEVIDINNCKDTVSKIIYIHDELQIFIPNTFTPNGDGLNDGWKPVLSDYMTQEYHLFIFDRWGQQIFHTTDMEEYWNATVNGKPVESNTIYSYTLTGKDISGKESKNTGKVMVLR
jgi:gliding motility-associated-like protein